MSLEQKELKELPFRKYYRSLEADEQRVFREKVCEATYSDVSSLNRWINRITIPSRVKAQIVADIAQKPIGELFPEYQK